MKKQYYFKPFEGQRVRVCTREELKERYPDYIYEINSGEYFDCPIGFVEQMYDFCGELSTIDKISYLNEVTQVAHFTLKNDYCYFTWDNTLVVPVENLEELMETQKPYKYRKER